MSWLGDLCETFESCHGAPSFADEPLNPVASMYQITHICIRLDGEGNFLGAEFSLQDRTLIPVTEASSGRSGKNPAPHPLSDKLRYCAADFEKWTDEPSRFKDYHQLLSGWCNSEHAHPKANAIRRYVEKKTMVADLVRAGVLHTQTRSKISVKRPKTKASLPMNDQGDAMIRWRVETPGENFPNAWEDRTLFSRWISYENVFQTLLHASHGKGQHRGVCVASGEGNIRLAQMHPRSIRFSSDGAKLISGNDENGFTFRGRFRSSDEACGVSFNVTQKAHNTLRWLIARQSGIIRPVQQVLISWAIGGQAIPDLQKNTGQLFLTAAQPAQAPTKYQANAELGLALQLDTLITSYREKLRQTEGVVVMGLDSATPGRMAITFYRKLTGIKFLERMQSWHERFAWLQAYPADKSSANRLSPLRNGFVGTPALREIAEAALGSLALGTCGKRLLSLTIERLLLCFVDGRPFPEDILESCFRNACHRTGFKDRRLTSSKKMEREREWENVLGIACGLYKGVHQQEGYQMSLEENRTSRDYLFGRLLAIAENIESHALNLAGERRDTNAARSMQRFADRPCDTWRHIELALESHRALLRVDSPTVLASREKLLDSVMGSFEEDEFVSTGKLSGEFLLGYHCQRGDFHLLEQVNDGESAVEEVVNLGKEEWALCGKKLILQ